MTSSHSMPLVLYADEDRLHSRQIEQIFEREGLRIQCVTNGEEALRRARELSPAIVILNADLPVAGGLEVLRRLRGAEETRDVPAIITSSRPRRRAELASATGLEASDWITRPFSPRELLARVRSKLRSQQLHTDLQQRTRELEALLHASEQLNRVKSVNELLELMPQLTLELLPGSLVALGRVDAEGALRARLVFHRDIDALDHEQESAFLTLLSAARRSSLLNEAPGLPAGWKGCMVSVTRHGENVQANTMLASPDERYSERQLHLLEGISQQAVLALDDASLHELITRQNIELEETVRERSADLESTRDMLVRSEKLVTIGHLAAGLAHEINNPLQPIRILLDDMLEDIRAGIVPEAEDVLHIQENIDRITRTVGQVLGFTRRDSEDSVFNELDPAEMLDAVVKLNQKLFSQEGIQVEVDLPSLPTVRGNRDQLVQVFMNLFLNARSAMTGGDRLTLFARPQSGHVEIRVSDTGHGIVPENLNEIFEPYFTTREEGRGLGLFISYSIIQKHRGTIEVESTPGRGSTFTVRLPVA